MFARRTQWNLQPNALSLAIERAKGSGRELLDLTASNPTDCGFSYDTERILRSLSQPEALHYEPAPFGIPKAREPVARYYAERGVTVDPARVMLTTSTSEAYSFIFRLLCDPEDDVLVPRPSYPLFDLLADVQDVRLKPYDLFYDHGWHLDLHSLERQLTARTRAVMVVSPNNPTGSYLEGAEAEALQRLCAAHGLAIVADEVFWDYALDGSAHRSWASCEAALTFTLGGLSKAAGLPQFKLAWTVVNGPDGVLSDALQRLEIIADTYLSVNAAIQHALPELLATASEFQAQVRERCRANLGHLQQCMGASDLLHVDAGWYAIVRIPALMTDEQFAIQLLEREDVLVHPGHFYNFTKEGYVVLSLLPEPTLFAEGVARVLSAVKRLL